MKIGSPALTKIIAISLFICTSVFPVRSIYAQYSSDSNLRVAIIGLIHSHAWGQLRQLPEMTGVDLVAIAEPVEDLRNEAKKYAPDAEYFTDYRKMLDEVKPEAVWAFVENNRHLEIVQVCAPRKIHCVFEKPLASTLADAREMVYLAKRYNIRLMTNYQMAWWPANYTAHEAAESGKLGDVWRLHAIIGHGGPGWPVDPGQVKKPGDYFFDWLNDEVKNGGGAFIDFQCYAALWTLWYIGKPESIQAMVNLRNPRRYKVDDNSVILCTYPEGVAILEGSWSLPRSFQDLQVFGDKGSLYLDRNGVSYRAGREEEKELPLHDLPASYKSPLEHLAHCIKNNEPLTRLVAPEINLEVMEIIEAARLSIKTGRKIDLPLH